ncbi:hypothetical protein GQ43DRAFT_185751 [Delitschia confertaspora ATCC 74209]|uniref:Uncharacterized protein n=1 Tax=Delitschia confertaspora ATCC 74209 TaxID=1513339 RepID=A0A9P4JEV8_9PLEO|nr:hypothetical protein GQ43DRAFT_185751 [Delitschia confertaspora ATCC 74209]
MLHWHVPSSGLLHDPECILERMRSNTLLERQGPLKDSRESRMNLYPEKRNIQYRHATYAAITAPRGRNSGWIPRYWKREIAAQFELHIAARFELHIAARFDCILQHGLSCILQHGLSCILQHSSLPAQTDGDESSGTPAVGEAKGFAMGLSQGLLSFRSGDVNQNSGR